MENIRTLAIARASRRSAQHQVEEHTYTMAVYQAAMALFDNGNTNGAVLAELEESVLVSFFIGQFGNLYPLSAENRRFHKVADDIRATFKEICEEARAADMRIVGAK